MVAIIEGSNSGDWSLCLNYGDGNIGVQEEIVEANIEFPSGADERWNFLWSELKTRNATVCGKIKPLTLEKKIGLLWEFPNSPLNQYKDRAGFLVQQIIDGYSLVAGDQ